MELWIARNKNGNLHMWVGEPQLLPGGYFFGNCDCIMDNDLFPEVTFENSPQKVKIELINGKER